MARGRLRMRASPPGLFGYAVDLMAVPRHFVAGWLVGILVPAAGLAGIVAGIYMFTRRIPFITQVEEEETGERRLILKLVEPDEARDLAQRGKEAAKAFGDEIRSEFEGEEL